MIVYNDEDTAAHSRALRAGADPAERRGRDRRRPEHGRVVRRGTEAGRRAPRPRAGLPARPRTAGAAALPATTASPRRAAPTSSSSTATTYWSATPAGTCWRRPRRPAPTSSPGMCVRVHVDSRNGKEVKWYPWLYPRTRTLESISELPDLLVFDTLSTNKCYRRDFLRRAGARVPGRHPLRGPAVLRAGVRRRPPDHPHPEPRLRLERRRQGRDQVDQQPARRDRQLRAPDGDPPAGRPAPRRQGPAGAQVPQGRQVPQARPGAAPA